MSKTIKQVKDRLPKEVDQSKVVQLAFKLAVENDGQSKKVNK